MKKVLKQGVQNLDKTRGDSTLRVYFLSMKKRLKYHNFIHLAGGFAGGRVEVRGDLIIGNGGYFGRGFLGR